jgi:hypothetical protein
MATQPLLAWKFGGTSLGDLGRLRAAAQRMVAARRAGHDELNAMAYALSTRPQLRELDALLSVREHRAQDRPIIVALASADANISGSRPPVRVANRGVHRHRPWAGDGPRRPKQSPAPAARIRPRARPGWGDGPDGLDHESRCNRSATSHGPLPGLRSAELLAKQDRCESSVRVYPQHIPIVVDEASGSFVPDLDRNVFIDLLTGAGVLLLGHSHPSWCGSRPSRSAGSPRGQDLLHQAATSHDDVR